MAKSRMTQTTLHGNPDAKALGDIGTESPQRGWQMQVE